MNRDHLLGWPPSLLAFDEVEPACHRRPAATATSVPVTRTRLSQAEQDQRAERDRNATAMLDAPMPVHLHTHKALATPSTEYRVRKNGDNIYRLRDGHVEFWHRFDKCWHRPLTARSWDIMIPAPESAIAALPAEALNT